MAVKTAVRAKESEKSMFSKIATGVKQKLPKTVSYTPDRAEIEEKIRRKAYEIFIRNGRQHGNDLAHWFEAERQVRA